MRICLPVADEVDECEDPWLSSWASLQFPEMTNPSNNVASASGGSSPHALRHTHHCSSSSASNAWNLRYTETSVCCHSRTRYSTDMAIWRYGIAEYR